MTSKYFGRVGWMRRKHTERETEKSARSTKAKGSTLHRLYSCHGVRRSNSIYSHNPEQQIFRATTAQLKLIFSTPLLLPLPLYEQQHTVT